MQTKLISGDTLTFLEPLSDYPASAGWVLTYRLVPRTTGQSAVQITGAAEGDAHRITASAATTAGWSTGPYAWSSYVAKGAERYTIASGHLEVRPNPANVAGGSDLRSVAEKALEDAKAALAVWSPTKRRYRIADREMEFNGQADIIALISYWETEVQRERNAAAMEAGQPSRRQIYVRLGRL